MMGSVPIFPTRKNIIFEFLNCGPYNQGISSDVSGEVWRAPARRIVCRTPVFRFKTAAPKTDPSLRVAPPMPYFRAHFPDRYGARPVSIDAAVA